MPVRPALWLGTCVSLCVCVCVAQSVRLCPCPALPPIRATTQIERAFGTHTAEIKANLERGTALPD